MTKFQKIVKIKRISDISDKEYAMAYKISDLCTNCASCESECPVEAISEADGKRVIDADTCVSCGACAGVCPVDAISEE